MPDGSIWPLLAAHPAIDVRPCRLYLDIETRSNINLVERGQYVYAECPTTAIILLSYAIDDGPIKTWFILSGHPMPDDLRAAILNPATVYVAHNASFERVLLTVVGRGFLDPEVHAALRIVERWSCTAARAALMGLPRSLDNAAKALNVPVRKDHEGYLLMLRMCMPLRSEPRLIWLEDWPSQRRLGDYCEVDVAVERLLDLDLPQQSEFEHKVWCTTERMNDHGIMVDGQLLNKLVFFAMDAEYAANRAIHAKTNGEVPKVTATGKLAEWLTKNGIDEAAQAGVGKWLVRKWLDDASLPSLLREVLTIRREGGKSSTKKFQAISNRLNYDHRIRGSLLYCGAPSTSRFSSRGAQLQNLPRGGTVKDMIQAIQDVMDDMSIDDIRRHGPPLVVASEMARPVFVAKPFHWLARGDYSQIEARVNAWVAGEEWKLKAFRDYDAGTGPDLYIAGAAQALGIPPEEVTPFQRQSSGKTGELACGFQGGIKALHAMARLYNLTLTDEEANTIKNNWRAANPKIVRLWYDLNKAAIACMKGEPGEKHEIRKDLKGLWFKRNHRAMALRVPGGGALIYWYPELTQVKTPWGEMRDAVTFMAEDSQKKIWVRHTLYGGLACENLCQKIARDLMADALVRMDAAGLAPRLTVHDEGLCEIAFSRCRTAKEAANLVREMMIEKPGWARGLPVAADASAHQRYMKEG